MAHHHHHHHEDDHLPKLPKRLGQVLFVLVVAILAAVSIFVYNRLIPLGEFVNEQEAKREVRKLCKEDHETMDQVSGEGPDCDCIADEMVKNPSEDLSRWVKESDLAARLIQYQEYEGICKLSIKGEEDLPED